jgi:hypothetical protein
MRRLGEHGVRAEGLTVDDWQMRPRESLLAPPLRERAEALLRGRGTA